MVDFARASEPYLLLPTCVERKSRLGESRNYYTVSQKKQDTKLLAITSLLSDFQNFFTNGLSSKFATNSCLNIPPHLKDVATLPCEI